MDTRDKIVDIARATEIARSGATVVSGYFDPLISSMAERLALIKQAALKQNGRSLLVLIRTPENAILPVRARAQLVAGLQVVDFVCAEESGITPSLDLDRTHAQQLAQLIAHVHARQQAK